VRRAKPEFIHRPKRVRKWAKVLRDAFSVIIPMPGQGHPISEANMGSPLCYLSDDYYLSNLQPLRQTQVSLVCEARLHVNDKAENVQVSLYSSSFFFRFDRETEAYERVISAGLEDIIPRVFGFMYWTSSKWEHDFPHILANGSGVYALITEWLESSYVEMSSQNVDFYSAASAVTSLDAIHRAGVLHGNVKDSFLLDLQRRKAVWVCFEDCRLPGEHTDQDLELEMQYVVDIVYAYYVVPLCLQLLMIVGFT
jgi:hypothetical protein